MVNKGLTHIIAPAVVAADAAMAPQSAVVAQVTMGWRAPHVSISLQPRQFDLERPVGPASPPPQYLKIQIDGEASIDQLGQAGRAFSGAAEIELIGTLGLEGGEAQQHRGGGKTVQWLTRPQLANNEVALGTSRVARARRWICIQIAWLGSLLVHLLKAGGD